MTALFIFNDAYFKQILIYHSNFINNLNSISNSDSERWQNSYFTADKIITNSEEGDLTLDAANLKAKRWEADIQNLTITSRQDTEKYESKQTSAGTSGSVAYGSGGSASVNASYNKAKVDYAQVNEQAGIRVGEGGIDANIHNHAQLNAAIIESSAEESKNRFKAKSISTTDIENRSEIKTESASIGAGTGGINPMQAISSTLSLLGNTNESARSTTKSAISGNIRIETETPENLTALSRDTKNANQRVEKQDLQKVQERQEMAKVIGDITNNAINIATYEEREKINKLGLEKFKLEEQEKALKGQAGNEQQLAAIKQQLTSIQAEITKTQGEIDRTYGIGSEKGMAIRAVTAALQAAAQNDTAGSLVALASPYLNQKIHEMTAGDTAKDKAANLMAHALLSAVEFQVTGKDPLTGAVAGVTGEATAEIIARAYGKPVSELTANEKENISTLSQLAGGLAAALTAKANGTTAEQGGNFLAATSGAETAKRAVENNYLSQISQKRRDELIERIKSGKANPTEIMEFLQYEKDDQTSDYLIDKAKYRPNEMTDLEWKQYEGYLNRYKAESLANRENPQTVENNLRNITSGNYFKGYGYPYALDKKYQSGLPSRWTTEGKSAEEELYEKFNAKYVTNPNTINNSFDRTVAMSTKEALELGASAYGAGKLLQGAKAIEGVMSNSTKFTLGVAGAGSVGAQLMSDGTVDPRSLAIDLATAYALKGKGFGLTVGGNAASGALNNYVTDKSMSQGAISSGIGSAIGYGMGKAIEVPLDKKINLDRTWAKYNPQSISNKAPYIESYRRNIVPNILGVAVGESGNRLYQLHFSSSQEND